jgi:large repetitive protein
MVPRHAGDVVNRPPSTNVQIEILANPGALAPSADFLNAPYSQSVAGSGGVGPYTFSITAGALPPGLSLDGSTGAISGTPTTAGSSTFTVTTTDANGCTASRSYTLTVNAAAVRYYTIAPCRLIDTRRPAGTYGGPALQGSGAQRSFLIDGQCGVPAGAVAVSANVTVVGASGRSDLRMFSTGTPTPTASTINFNPGQTRASNAILSMVGTPVGSITVQCDIPSGTTNMLLDVNGYFR